MRNCEDLYVDLWGFIMIYPRFAEWICYTSNYLMGGWHDDVVDMVEMLTMTIVCNSEVV